MGERPRAHKFLKVGTEEKKIVLQNENARVGALIRGKHLNQTGRRQSSLVGGV